MNMKRMSLTEIFRTLARELEMGIRRSSGWSFNMTPAGAPGSLAMAPLRHRKTRVDAGLVHGVFGTERPPIPVSPPAHGPSGRSRASDLVGISEYVAISEPVEPGDVLVLDRERQGSMRLGSVAADSAVFGVVSGEARAKNTLAPVIFSGVVLCKVDASFGPIKNGDSLCVAPTRGHAMLSSCRVPGTILGMALEPLPSGRKRIRVLVTIR